MTHLLALVLLIGIVDSANPSTIAPALYFAAGDSAHTSLLGFIAGVFLTSLAAGVLLVVGPGQALMSLAPHPGVEVRHLIELIAGVLTLALAIGLWLSRYRLAGHVSHLTRRIEGSSLVVGAGIVVVELPTALPYFAVIATLVGSGRSLGTQIALLVIFNVTFTAPLIAILTARSLLGERALAWLERLRTTLDRKLAMLIPALVLVVSIALLAIGGHGVLTD